MTGQTGRELTNSTERPLLPSTTILFFHLVPFQRRDSKDPVPRPDQRHYTRLLPPEKKETRKPCGFPDNLLFRSSSVFATMPRGASFLPSFSCLARHPSAANPPKKTKPAPPPPPPPPLPAEKYARTDRPKARKKKKGFGRPSGRHRPAKRRRLPHCQVLGAPPHRH